MRLTFWKSPQEPLTMHYTSFNPVYKKQNKLLFVKNKFNVHVSISRSPWHFNFRRSVTTTRLKLVIVLQILVTCIISLPKLFVCKLFTLSSFWVFIFSPSVNPQIMWHIDGSSVLTVLVSWTASITTGCRDVTMLTALCYRQMQQRNREFHSYLSNKNRCVH